MGKDENPLTRSRRAGFAKGASSAEALNTCVHCGDAVNVNKIKMSSDYGDAVHYFDEDGAGIAVDVKNGLDDHYGPGRHCTSCGNAATDAHEHEKHMEAHHESSQPDTTYEQYES